MNFTLQDDYITLLLQRLGRRSDNTLRESVIDELNQAQRQLEAGRFVPWFLQATTVLNLTVGLPDIAFPTDFIREVEDKQPFITDSANYKWQLDKGDNDVLSKKYFNSANGKIKYYAVQPNTFSLFPYPDEDCTFTFSYYQMQPVIADGELSSANLWFTYFPSVLLNTAGEMVASLHIQKPDMAARFAKAAAMAKDDMLVQHEARMHTNMNYSDDSEYQTA